DVYKRNEVMETILKLNREQGITIILITHYMEEAALAERVVVIDNGEMILDNTPVKVFSQVEHMKALGLDVPQVTELAWELNRAGFQISPEILTEPECIAALEKLL
ncbi:MAG: energy-coupling factor transporter ATPase, partial [Oscillospiraceae bacterium]|nr:energy-coupling factor transporter ATPase [Oscillospiraceae bacterium]